MGLRINQNIAAFNAHRHLVTTDTALSKSLERLSSGFRINRAADDAAGLAISEKLRAQVRGFAQAIRNGQDGIAMIQTAEGALNEVHAMLQRMRELAVQAANDTLSPEDRAAVNTEIQALREEIDNVSARTTFNGKNLLDGSLVTSLDTTSDVAPGFVIAAGSNTSVTAVDVSGAAGGTTFTFTYDSGTNTLTLSDGSVSQNITLGALAANSSTVLSFSQLGVRVTIATVDAVADPDNIGGALDTQTVVTAAGSGSANLQVGPNSSDAITISFDEVSIAALGLTATLDAFDAAQNVANAQALIDALDDAIGEVSTRRAQFGAAQNRLEHTIASLGVASENMAAAESRVRDADMAKEMVAFTRAQILLQAGTAMLAQANAAPQAVLQLLR